ncbi:hypothetical protein [Chitinophaga sp. Cy-1792]|uniref:hypothetical protein n=1 Tax=Chitinophaga sp. Cy-1792 TaxID=2608339 RepID=UPI0014211081|nr:hypothetical protein [Chitinophaga sp. Cy-1792]NIG56905.1 hypothetical protein [Chitinophaga sp. Cy-1792]
MKKFMLIGAALSVMFVACSKKDDDKTTVPVAPTDSTAPGTKIYNASALTTASVASHGTIVKGALPAASAATGTPVLSSTIAEDTYSAIAGRYLIIPLTLTSGEITGAYVQFQGADSYFKVDFSRTTNGRTANQKTLLGRSIYGNGNDSIVAIKVPADVATGVVKVLISVYDKAGNASKSITVSANLFNTAASAENKALSGKWSVSRHRDVNHYTNTMGDWVNPFVYVYSNSFYICKNNKLTYTSDSTVAGATKIATTRWIMNEQYIQLNADGSGKSVASASLDILSDNNTCSSRNYESHVSAGSDVLGWYYNPTTKKFYMIGDLMAVDANAFYVGEYDAKLENGILTISDEDGTTEYVKK